jgi:hypothetical protein
VIDEDCPLKRNAIELALERSSATSPLKRELKTKPLIRQSYTSARAVTPNVEFPLQRAISPTGY